MSATAGPTRSEALRQLEDEVTVMFRRIKRLMLERAHAVHPELSGLGLPMLLRIAAGPVRSSALAEEFQMDKGSVSRQIQQLEDLGLVQRTPDPADGRATLLSATADASRRLDDIEQARREGVEDRLVDWSAADLAALAEQLKRYNRSLDRRPAHA